MAKHEWKVEVDGHEHLLQLEHSFWSGQRMIWVDRELIFQQRGILKDRGSVHPLQVGTAKFELRISWDRGWSYVLFREGDTDIPFLRDPERAWKQRRIELFAGPIVAVLTAILIWHGWDQLATSRGGRAKLLIVGLAMAAINAGWLKTCIQARRRGVTMKDVFLENAAACETDPRRNDWRFYFRRQAIALLICILSIIGSFHPSVPKTAADGLFQFGGMFSVLLIAVMASTLRRERKK